MSEKPPVASNVEIEDGHEDSDADVEIEDGEHEDSEENVEAEEDTDPKVLADEAKGRGNEHFKNGRFDEAVKEFTAAIKADSENHVYYSNRAGALTKLKKYKRALEDAGICTRMKPTWPKGWSRKGVALHGLGRFQEAGRAFEKALEFDPDNAGYKQEIVRCNRGLNKPAASARPAAASGNTGKSLYEKSKVFRYCMLAGHLCVLPLAVVSLAPVGVGYLAFSIFLKLALVLQLVAVVHAVGRPRLSKDYLQNLLLEPESHWLVLALIFHLGRPFFLAVLPQCGRSLVIICAALKQFPKLPLASKIEYIATNPGEVYTFTASMEVLIGFIFIVDLITPNRNILLLVMWWQYMRVRYMLAGEWQRRSGQPQPLPSAFNALKLKLDSGFLHARSPSFVQSAYIKVIGMMANAVDPVAQQAAQQGGLMSKCSIM